MATSGLEVEEMCVTKFLSMKQNHDFKWISLVLSDDFKKVTVGESLMEEVDPKTKKSTKKYLQEGEDEKCWNEMVKDKLRDDVPAYILYNIHGYDKEKKEVDKIIFITWCSDMCPVKRKMVFASTKKLVADKLTGVAKSFQASSMDELNYKDIWDEVTKKSK